MDIRKWLQDDVFQERDTILLTSKIYPAKMSKMSQLELNFSGILKRNDKILKGTVPEGRKPSTETTKVQRKMTRKELAKVNTKMTTFLRKPLSPQDALQDALEEVHELESGMRDTAVLERHMVIAEHDRIWRNARMVTALLKDLLNEVPGRGVAMRAVNIVVDSAWGKLMDRVVAREAVTGIMDEMMDKAWWRFRVEDVWNTIRYEKEIQKVII